MTSKYSKFVRALLIAILMLAMLAISLRHLGASISLQASQLDHLPEKQINWSRFAYTQYATDRSYLCNSVMIFEALHRLGSKADLVLMYPSNFLVSENDDSPEAHLLRFARDKYAVKLKPMEVIYKGGGGETWSRSYTKLLTFNQTEYDRVLHLDSDATLLQTMDELFLLPSAPVAMPLAYWFHQEDKVFTSALMLIEPSTAEFSRLTDEIWDGVSGGYDMDIVNRLYGDTALIIPHRPYMLLTGEFRSKDHEAYLGNADEMWDADKALEAAKYLHFSDWPVPKVTDSLYWRPTDSSSAKLIEFCGSLGSQPLSTCSKRRSHLAKYNLSPVNKMIATSDSFGWGCTKNSGPDDRIYVALLYHEGSLRNGSPFQSFRFKIARIERMTSILESRKFSI